MSKITRVTRITGVSRTTKITGMTRVTGMTKMTRVTRVTWMTRVIKISRLTGLTRMTAKKFSFSFSFSLAVQPSYQSVRNKLSAVQPFGFIRFKRLRGPFLTRSTAVRFTRLTESR